MASETSLPVLSPTGGQHQDTLHAQWRTLARAATFVAVLTSPAAYMWFHNHEGWSVMWSLLATVGEIGVFRGVIEVGFRYLIPSPSMFGIEDPREIERDVVHRRRHSFWRFWLVFSVAFGSVLTVIWYFTGDAPVPLLKALGSAAPQILIYVVFLFFMNFLILFGPLALMGISQIQAFEPGDADWGVDLADVRGQAEAKEEVRRVVTLWQSGERFEQAGGKRERGLLMLGAPGTGKTMLSKAVATSFNSPFVSIPGSGFAQTFIGMDAVIVRYLARKARKLARKWGGQCIVFIDEIDAVGMRRSSLGANHHFSSPSMTSIHDLCFYGPMGALNPSGDLLLETAAWRERVFASRGQTQASPYPAFWQRFDGIRNQVLPGGMFGGGGQLALNQLLVVMDGIGNPPFVRKTLTRWVNTSLDALYVIPQRLGPVPLRMPKPRPRKEQIYFVGACNVPIEALDPALTRPGRLGRHVWFRTPTKDDRKDIFDLYLGKVSHETDLDSEHRRDELARMTPGYSPAMIDQVCSMALTRAHYDARQAFSRDDIIESMTTVESGMAVNIDYPPEETRHIAVHEAGHAVAAHVYLEGRESTRLSVRMRGGSLGHHAARDVQERFVHWQEEQTGDLIWGLGAMAAEHVFYGQNSTGVGGDVASATATAALMVGMWGMGSPRIDMDRSVMSAEQAESERRHILGRLEGLGVRIMRRSSGGMFENDPTGGVLGDRDKRAMAAQNLGYAYVAAYNLVRANRDAVSHIADVLVERREFYGDDVVALLNAADIKKPALDLTKEETWPDMA
jgi:cell division protease FtsH